MNKEEIKNLRSQKDHLQVMIYNCIQMKQDAKQLVIEYHKIVDKIVSAGGKVYIRSPYLKLEYWNLTPQDVISDNITPIIQKESQEDNYYILNLAWTDTSESNVVDYIKKYFDSMGIKELSYDQNEKGVENEYIIQYEFKGSDDSFQMLKKSATVILDMLSKQNFNIAIYGKKRIY